jgi:hypothetical protein
VGEVAVVVEHQQRIAAALDQGIGIRQQARRRADAGRQPAPSRQRRFFAVVSKGRDTGGKCSAHHGMSQDIHARILKPPAANRRRPLAARPAAAT